MFSSLSKYDDDILHDAATDIVQAFMRMVDKPANRGFVES